MEFKGRITIPGSESYWDAHDLSAALSERFPEEGIYDLSSAIQYNASWPDGELLDIKLIHEGERDESDWVWAVTVRIDEYRKRVMIGTGGCDYTGWDCQSNFTWVSSIEIWG